MQLVCNYGFVIGPGCPIMSESPNLSGALSSAS
jgi:hypothetical protein